jgi:putative chitinase
MNYLTQSQYSAMIAQKSGGYSQNSVKAWSYYNDQPPAGISGVQGNSTIGGDISASGQVAIINQIIQAANSAGFTTYQTAYLLALVRYESGFNPDAAAGTSSALGLGQMLDGTASENGLTGDDRWDAQAQITAMVEYFGKGWAATVGQGDNPADLYEWWHDGAGNFAKNPNGPGLNLSKQNVMPWVNVINGLISGENLSSPSYPADDDPPVSTPDPNIPDSDSDDAPLLFRRTQEIWIHKSYQTSHP